ncbi:MAG TPA: hypothetical protein VLE99_06555 [Candidatus Saccharimonadales bacterium]|nr:hypothetical protein [Candidatus Saccharimonadales bacterium]
MLFTILGIASSLIFLVCDFPYLQDTIRAKIKPHRVTWGVIALLNTAGFANQLASGARNSLWLFGAGTLMTGAIFVASLKNGVGGRSRQDIFAAITCLVGVAFWIVFKSPVFSILANLLVAVVALLPTFAKAKKSPETETKIAWLGGMISSSLAAASVGQLDWQLLILPVSSAALNAYMVYLLYVRSGHSAPNRVSPPKLHQPDAKRASKAA